MSESPELLNASRDKEKVEACTEGLVEHDYRPFTDTTQHRHPTYLRCVWCHAVACGHITQTDPCIEVWHHEPEDHRTALGVTWPIGGDRRDR